MLGLDKCLDLRKDINEVDNKISELRGVVYAPKTQILSFAPSKGGVVVNKFDAFLINLERLDTRRIKLEEELNRQWRVTEAKLREIGATEDQIELMRCRFFHGLPWKTCCSEMQVSYPEKTWNEAKLFRVYRKIKGVEKKLLSGYNDIME